MAEVMLRWVLTERNCPIEVDIASAGTWAYEGNPATTDAVDAMRARGIDVSAHASRPVDKRELEETDLIVVMTSVHVREVLDVAPGVEHKLVMLKEIAEMEPDLSGVGSPTEGLRRLLAATRPEPRRSLDVDDPMGLPLMAYERCANDLERGINALADLLCLRSRAGSDQ